MGCAFTDSASTHDGTCISDCRKSARPFAMVGCTFCIPGRCLVRCTNCYGKFASKDARRCEEIESSQKGDKVYSTWALRGLFNIDWRALGRDSTDVKAARAEEFLQLVDGQLRWRKPCPSCYTFCVPGIQPSMPSNFKELDPVVAGECIVDFDARQLIADARKPVRVAVVLLEPVITYCTTSRAAFSFGPPTRQKKLQLVRVCVCVSARDETRLGHGAFALVCCVS
jgi:hypothetical protein